ELDPTPVCWMPEYTVNGEPELMLEMLSNSQPSVTFLLMACRKPMLSRCMSWATLRPKPWATSKVDGPFSGCVSKGFCGLAWTTAPVEPVLPKTMLVSSMDLPQV